MITPVWLDEIQNNKIFNKQKKKLLREVLFYEFKTFSLYIVLGISYGESSPSLDR